MAAGSSKDANESLGSFSEEDITPSVSDDESNEQNDMTITQMYKLLRADFKREMEGLKKEMKTARKEQAKSNVRLEKIENGFSTLAMVAKKQEEKLEKVDKRVSSIEKGSTNLKAEIQKVASDIRNELKEERDQILRKNNVVVFGIPENEYGDSLFDDLWQAILPDDFVNFCPERIGGEDKQKPRPIRVCLPNMVVKKRVLSNRKNLAGIEKFKKVSVVPDRTRAQQLERARSPVVTRSQSATAAAPGASSGNRGGTEPGKRTWAESNGEQELDPNKRAALHLETPQFAFVVGGGPFSPMDQDKPPIISNQSQI